MGGVALVALAGVMAIWPRISGSSATANAAPSNPYVQYGYGGDGLPLPGVSQAPIPSPNPSQAAVIANTRQNTTVEPHELPIAAISIPSIGLKDVPVYDRGLDSHRRMQIAAGFAATHYKASSPLGGASNSVIYGHDDIEGGVFGHLKQLQPGDQIIVSFLDGSKLNYVVREQKLVLPNALSILSPTSTPTLTLFSCYPLWVDDQRVVVTAVPAT